MASADNNSNNNKLDEESSSSVSSSSESQSESQSHSGGRTRTTTSTASSVFSGKWVLEPEDGSILSPDNNLEKSQQRTCIRGSIICLAICGILCGVLAACSCDWFVWRENVDVDKDTSDLLLLPEMEHVGLFRYRPSSSSSSSSCRAYGFGSSPLTILANATAQAGPDNTDDDNDYDDEETLKRFGPWIRASRSCLIAALVGALVALILALRSVSCARRPGGGGAGGRQQRRRRFVVSALLWLLVTGLQAASSLTATALCGNGSNVWECPWIQGAHLNGLAAIMFLLCWLLTLCGTVVGDETIGHDQETGDRYDVVYHHHYHHDKHQSNKTNPSNRSSSICNTTTPGLLRPYEMDLDVDDDNVHEEPTSAGDVELGPPPSPPSPPPPPSRLTTQSANDLLGTDDPIIHRAVGNRARVMREFATTATTSSSTGTSNQ